VVMPFMLLYFQFLVGIIQMIMSTILFIRQSSRTQLIRIHWFSSVTVLILLAGLAKLDVLSDNLYWIILIGIPWMLAIMFWYASRLLYKAKMES
jgi:hypothetical protein